ncbi:MAG: hypothetical protein H7315_17820 [Herminiimonas sp.]|nr:hypothetical protein [Herminiimonas sp.]
MAVPSCGFHRGGERSETVVELVDREVAENHVPKMVGTEIAEGDRKPVDCGAE